MNRQGLASVLAHGDIRLTCGVSFVKPKKLATRRAQNIRSSSEVVVRHVTLKLG